MLSRAFDHICMEKARYKFIIIIIIIIIINVTQKINGIFFVCLFVCLFFSLRLPLVGEYPRHNQTIPLNIYLKSNNLK